MDRAFSKGTDQLDASRKRLSQPFSLNVHIIESPEVTANGQARQDALRALRGPVFRTRNNGFHAAFRA